MVGSYHSKGYFYPFLQLWNIIIMYLARFNIEVRSNMPRHEAISWRSKIFRSHLNHC